MGRVFIIAEAGVNHNGDLALAERLVDEAARAGADAVKFQAFEVSGMTSKAAPKAGYQKKTTDPEESQAAMLSRLALSAGDHRHLMGRAKSRGIGFLSSPFDLASLRMLHDLGLTTIKIPSGEISNLPYLREAARLGQQFLLSTGMADLDEVGAALTVFIDAGVPRENITLLHCVTEYPAHPDSVNLLAMRTLADTFKTPVGFSDHTKGIQFAVAAAALGATVIEKHLTLDKTLPGPDHRASLEPHEFAALVGAVRDVEAGLGDGVKRPAAAELKNRDVARKSIVAGRNIAKGEVFSEENLAVKRPGTGLSPMEWDRVLGLAAKRNFTEDELIEL